MLALPPVQSDSYSVAQVKTADVGTRKIVVGLRRREKNIKITYDVKSTGLWERMV